MYKIVITIFAFVLCLTSCSNNDTLSPSDDELPENMPTQEIVPSKNDGIVPSEDYHQIFHGTWEITQFIPGGRFSEKDKAETLIGNFVEFSAERIAVNDTILIESPQYFCVLVATEDSHRFWKYFYPDDPSDVLNLESPYFAYIYVRKHFAASENESNNVLGYMRGFYIKDSETLVFDSSVGLLEMKRLSYLEGYESRIEGV